MGARSAQRARMSLDKTRSWVVATAIRVLLGVTVDDGLTGQECTWQSRSCTSSGLMILWDGQKKQCSQGVSSEMVRGVTPVAAPRRLRHCWRNWRGESGRYAAPALLGCTRL